MTEKENAQLEAIKHETLIGPDGLTGAKTPAEYLRDDVVDFFTVNRAAIGKLDTSKPADRAVIEGGYKDSLAAADVKKALTVTKNKQTGEPAMSEGSWKKYLRRSLDYLLALSAGKVRAKDGKFTVAHHVGADHGRVIRGIYPEFRKATKAERKASEAIQKAHDKKFPPQPEQEATDGADAPEAAPEATDGADAPEAAPAPATDAARASEAAEQAEVATARSNALAEALDIAERNMVGGSDCSKADLLAAMRAIHDLLLPHVARPSKAA